MSEQSQAWRNQDERRYELERDVAERVLAELNAQLSVIIYDNQPATTLVATLYFDTPSQYYFERAKLGKESSIKVRAREYFPISDDEERAILGQAEHCYLERKERRGTIRDKDRIRVHKSELAPIIEHISEISEDSAVLRNEIRNHSLLPAMISMYERRVWGSGDGLRVTLDERIRYHRPPDRVYGGISAMAPSQLGQPYAAGPKRILEVKQDAKTTRPPWLASLLAEVPEAQGFSKFLDGMRKLAQNQKEHLNLTRPLYKLP